MEGLGLQGQYVYATYKALSDCQSIIVAQIAERLTPGQIIDGNGLIDLMG